MVQLKFIILKVFIVKRILIFIIQINTIKKNKVVYRNLNNPTNDMHGFYPTPEEAQFGAIPRSSIYDFDYTFEQIKSYILNNLDKSHLEQVLLYLGNLNQDDKIEKTR